MASGETHEQTHDVAIDTSARQQQSQPESVASLWTPLSGAETSWLDASVRGALGQGRGVQASRESMLLRMQATMSNTAVQRLVEQDTAGAARRTAIVIQRQPPGARHQLTPTPALLSNRTTKAMIFRRTAASHT
jgi:hypothetical protein